MELATYYNHTLQNMDTDKWINFVVRKLSGKEAPTKVIVVPRWQSFGIDDLRYIHYKEFIII